MGKKLHLVIGDSDKTCCGLNVTDLGVGRWTGEVISPNLCENCKNTQAYKKQVAVIKGQGYLCCGKGYMAYTSKQQTWLEESGLVEGDFVLISSLPDDLRHLSEYLGAVHPIDSIETFGIQVDGYFFPYTALTPAISKEEREDGADEQTSESVFSANGFLEDIDKGLSQGEYVCISFLYESGKSLYMHNTTDKIFEITVKEMKLVAKDSDE